MENSEINFEQRKKRLLFRANHRGFIEADLLLGGYANQMVPNMTPSEVIMLEALLEFEDEDIYAALTGKKPPLNSMNLAVLDDIRQFHGIKILQNY